MKTNMCDLAKKIHMRTIRRSIAWLLLTVIMITHVDTASIIQAIGAEKSKNWDVEYYLVMEDDDGGGIPIPEEEGISTLMASYGDTVHFNMVLSDQGRPDSKRFDEIFTITMPEWLYQQLTDFSSEPLTLGETEATECGCILEEVIETTSDKGTASNVTAGNATVSNATSGDEDADIRKVKLRFVEELRGAEDPEDIEIEEQQITLSFTVPFDTTITGKQDANDFAIETASASNLRPSPLRSTDELFQVEWELTVDGTTIKAGETVTIQADTEVRFDFAFSTVEGKCPSAADYDEFEYTIILPKALYERMMEVGGEIVWPEIVVDGNRYPLFNEPSPKETSAGLDIYELTLTFGDAIKGMDETFRLTNASGYFNFITEEKIDLSYEVNEDEDSTTITYQPPEEVMPSIKVSKAIRSIFNEKAYRGADGIMVNSGDYVIYTITLTLQDGVDGETYEIPAGSVYESFHGGVYSYIDMMDPSIKTKFTDILENPNYSTSDSQKELITDLFKAPYNEERLAWVTATGTIPSEVPNSSNSEYEIMMNKERYTLSTDNKNLYLYICLQVTDEIDKEAITSEELKNNVYFDDEDAENPKTGVGPGKGKNYYDAALQIYPGTIWRVSDQVTKAGIPVQIGDKYNYPDLLTNENAAVHPGDFVTFAVVPYMQGTATSYVKSIDVYVPLGFEPVTVSSELPDDYKYYTTAASSTYMADPNYEAYRYFGALQQTYKFTDLNDPDFEYGELYEVRRYTFTWDSATAATAPRLYFTCRVNEIDDFLIAAGMDPANPADREIGQRYCYLMSAEISALLDEQRNLLFDGDNDSWTDNNPFNDWYNKETGKLKNKKIYLDPEESGKSGERGEIDGSYNAHVRDQLGVYAAGTAVSPNADEDDFDFAIVWRYDDEEEVKQDEPVLKEIVDTNASATTAQIKSMMEELAALDPSIDIYQNYVLPVNGKVTQTKTIVPYCVTVNPEGIIQDMKGVKLVDTLPQSMEFLCTPDGDPVVSIYEVIESGGYRFPAVNAKGDPITYIHPDYCKSYLVKKPLDQAYEVNSGIDYYKPSGIIDGKWQSSVNAARDKLTIDFGDIEDNCYQVCYYAIVKKESYAYENGVVLTWNSEQKESSNIVINYNDKGALARGYGKAVSLDGETYTSADKLPADSTTAELYYRLQIQLTASGGTAPSYEPGELFYEDLIIDPLDKDGNVCIDPTTIVIGDKDGNSNPGATLFEAGFDEARQSLIVTNKEKIDGSFEVFIFFRVTFENIRYGDVISNAFGGVTTTVQTPLKLDLRKIDGDDEEGLENVEFKLTYSDDTAVEDVSGAAIILTTDKYGMDSVNFIPDSSKQENNGTYTLYLTEIAAPDGYFRLGGKNSEPASGYVIKIMVEEEAEGQYVFRASDTGQEDYYEVSTGSANEIQVTAKNYKYPAPETTKETFGGKKTLMGAGAVLANYNGQFSFTLTQTGGPTTVLAVPETKTNNINDGSEFTFSELEFTKAGKYTFTVKEIVGTITGITYGTTTYTITVEVTLNVATNELGSTVTINNGTIDAADIEFVNEYTAPDTNKGYLKIKKVSRSSGTSLSGAEFELLYRNKGSEDAWIGYGGTLVTAGSDGSINLELPEKYWNYEYKLTETKAPSGYSNSRVGTILFTMLQNGTIDSWSSNGTTGYVELSADDVTFIVKNHTGGGGGGGGTTPDTPDPPTNPTTPTIPETPNPPLPPVAPGGNVVPSEDGSYYEVDENGVALGRWYQDEDGNWIFDDEVPLAGLTKTGEQNTQWLMLLMCMSGLGGAALVCKRRKDEET